MELRRVEQRKSQLVSFRVNKKEVEYLEETKGSKTLSEYCRERIFGEILQ